MSTTARKQQRRRVPADWIGIKRLPESELKFGWGLAGEIADELTIATTEHTPWASDVFDEQEMEERLQRMEARFAARMPTEGGWPDLEHDNDPDQQSHPVCWGCGDPAPQKMGNFRFGWHLRIVNLMPGKPDVVELCCPDCWIAIGGRWY